MTPDQLPSIELLVDDQLSIHHSTSSSILLSDIRHTILIMIIHHRVLNIAAYTTRPAGAFRTHHAVLPEAWMVVLRQDDGYAPAASALIVCSDSAH